MGKGNKWFGKTKVVRFDCCACLPASSSASFLLFCFWPPSGKNERAKLLSGSLSPFSLPPLRFRKVRLVTRGGDCRRRRRHSRRRKSRKSRRGDFVKKLSVAVVSGGKGRACVRASGWRPCGGRGTKVVVGKTRKRFLLQQSGL